MYMYIQCYILGFTYHSLSSSAHMWLEQQHLKWKVGRFGIEAKLSNPLLLCLLLPLATTDAVRLGGGEVDSSLVHTCTALHHDEKREERKGNRG